MTNPEENSEEYASEGEFLPEEAAELDGPDATDTASSPRDDESNLEAAAIPDPLEEIEKWKNLAARSQAELDNYRKRIVREKTETIQYANRGLLEQLLPIIDNFEMGIKAAESSGEAGAIIVQGMAMVRKQFADFLSDQGVEIIPSDRIPFDPHLHEAVRYEANDAVPEGQVIYTIRNGYRLRDRVLRAANVVVSSGASAES